MQDIVNLLSQVIEQPYVKKGYVELKKYYILINMKNEADAIEHLIQIRFNETRNIHIDSKQ